MSEPERKGASSPAEEERPPARAWLIAGAAWAVPGLGHLLLGRWVRALLFAALVLGSVAIGCALDGPLYFFEDGFIGLLLTLASMGLGVPYFAILLSAYVGDAVSLGFEYGKAFVVTGGLMNLLVMLDAFDVACGRKE